MLQGSVQSPLLFLIVINDLDDNLVNKFADDTKVGSKMDCEKGYL